MAESRVLEHALRRVLWELRDYLPDLLLIGGWVPFLYRRYAGFRDWRGRESLTFEVDLLTEEELPTEGKISVSERLQEAGFRPLSPARHAAVWVRDPEAGEKVEFFVEHRGTARGRGSVRPIGQQPGLGAISLAGLQFMREHSAVLTVPVRDAGGNETSLEVRAPLLGAFAVNKALTFPQRAVVTTDNHESKPAKDLLYLRDLMAAGAEVTEHIGQQIKAFTAEAGPTDNLLAQAARNLRLLRRGQWTPTVREVGRMLVERGDQNTEDAAVADVRGHIDDFLELLNEESM